MVSYYRENIKALVKATKLKFSQGGIHENTYLDRHADAFND